MAYIKRGEAKTVPVRVKFNDMDVFPLGNVDEIAFKLGDSVRKTWPDAVRYDNANGRFRCPSTRGRRSWRSHATSRARAIS